MSSSPLDRTGSARHLRSARWLFAVARGRLGSLSAAHDALASAVPAHRPRSARWLRFQAAASPACRPAAAAAAEGWRSDSAQIRIRHVHASCLRAESASRDPWPWPWPWRRRAHRSPNFFRSLAAPDRPARAALIRRGRPGRTRNSVPACARSRTLPHWGRLHAAATTATATVTVALRALIPPACSGS